MILFFFLMIQLAFTSKKFFFSTRFPFSVMEKSFQPTLVYSAADEPNLVFHDKKCFSRRDNHFLSWKSHFNQLWFIAPPMNQTWFFMTKIGFLYEIITFSH